MNKLAFRTSVLLVALTAALLGTAFATALPAAAAGPVAAIDVSLVSGPEWSVFLAP